MQLVAVAGVFYVIWIWISHSHSHTLYWVGAVLFLFLFRWLGQLINCYTPLRDLHLSIHPSIKPIVSIPSSIRRRPTTLVSRYFHYLSIYFITGKKENWSVAIVIKSVARSLASCRNWVRRQFLVRCMCLGIFFSFFLSSLPKP